MNKNEQMRHSKRRRIEIDFRWPEVPFHIVLVAPSIPPNTGNIARLCAATGTTLHLVEPLGFDLSEKQLRRAGLDYWDSVNLFTWPDVDAYLAEHRQSRKILFSTAGKRSMYAMEFEPGDHLIFGNETTGLPDEIIARHPADQVCNIPIRLDHVRSLNLSNCASITLYEALRQMNR